MIKNFSFIWEGLVGVNVVWKGTKYNFVDMYAPCCMVKRKNSWKTLLDVKRGGNRGEWCVGCDLNFVNINEEKRGLRARDK